MPAIQLPLPNFLSDVPKRQATFYADLKFHDLKIFVLALAVVYDAKVGHY